MKTITRDLSLLMDFYQLTMANGYFKDGLKDQEVIFEMFFRRVPDGGGFAIMCGLQQVIEYINHLTFTDEDITFLRNKHLFDEAFLEYLKNFKCTLDIYAFKEGTPIFPNEPIIKVVGSIIQAQLIETMILLTVNHQSLIATKANRIVRSAEGKVVMEFGARRAHGYDAALYGARAAYIGGVNSSANVLSDKLFDIPSVGTMAHSFVQLYPDEYTAFKKYCWMYPNNASLLVDTYNVLKSGVPNAILVAKEVLHPMGQRLKSIRLDSGDLTYLSKKARKMLDQAGMQDCKIIVSNSLDEYMIQSLLIQGACIDYFGVGERLISAKSEPVFGGVYKIAAVKENGKFEPRIKISENIEKITTPADKEVYRLYDENHKAIADVLTLKDEVIDTSKPYTIFDPISTWKRKELVNFTVEPMLVPIFIKGKQVYQSPSVSEIREYCIQQVQTLWEESLRFENPHNYYVDLSKPLWDLKQELLESKNQR
ncbi:nicotinate phosphoribosyltransferase [Erysipelotrichaceae bacterium OH741_COT-311]|nr:nicotinate phosphoribosyltransferase [Erysipelotrichaceae bacterium OH741_COT-311]